MTNRKFTPCPPGQLAQDLAALADAQAAQRAADMPTEVEAVHQLWRAAQRLQELGWRRPDSRDHGETRLTCNPLSTGRHKAACIDMGDEDWGWEHWDGEESWSHDPFLVRPLTDGEKASGIHTFGSEHFADMPAVGQGKRNWINAPQTAEAPEVGPVDVTHLYSISPGAGHYEFRTPLDPRTAHLADKLKPDLSVQQCANTSNTSQILHCVDAQGHQLCGVKLPPAGPDDLKPAHITTARYRCMLQPCQRAFIAADEAALRAKFPSSVEEHVATAKSLVGSKRPPRS